MAYQAIVTDLDGTVVRRDLSVSPVTLRAFDLLRAAGITRIAASARTPLGVRMLTDLMGHLSFVVSCNGAVGWRPDTGDVVWRHTFDRAAVAELVKFLDAELPGVGVAGYRADEWLMTAEYAAMRRPGPGRRVVELDDLVVDDVCLIAVGGVGTDSQELWDIVRRHELEPLLVTSISGAGVMEISPPGVDKAHGVRQALALFDIDPAAAVAFGDMPNDVPMLALCGVGVAMGNAHPAARAAADIVADDVEADGFAQIVRQLGLIP